MRSGGGHRFPGSAKAAGNDGKYPLRKFDGEDAGVEDDAMFTGAHILDRHTNLWPRIGRQGNPHLPGGSGRRGLAPWLGGLDDTDGVTLDGRRRSRAIVWTP